MIDDHHTELQAPDPEEEFARLQKLLRSLPEISAPENFEQELLRKLKERKETPAPWWKKLFSGERMVFHIPPIAYGAAATVAIVFIGYYIITSRNVLETPSAPTSPGMEYVTPSPSVKHPNKTELSQGAEDRSGIPTENDVPPSREKKDGGRSYFKIAPEPATPQESITPNGIIQEPTEESMHLFRSRGAYGLEIEDSLEQIDSLVSLDSLQNTQVPQGIKSKKKLPPDK